MRQKLQSEGLLYCTEVTTSKFFQISFMESWHNCHVVEKSWIFFGTLAHCNKARCEWFGKFRKHSELVTNFKTEVVGGYKYNLGSSKPI